MRKVISLLLFIFCANNTNAQTLHGLLNPAQFQNKTIYLKEILGNNTYKIDSTTIDDQGKFNINTSQCLLGYYTLGFENNEIQIIINPRESVVTISFGEQKLKNDVIVQSSLENKLLWSYKYKSRDTQFELQELKQSGGQNKEAKVKSIELLLQQKEKFKDSLITSYPKTFFSQTIKSSLSQSFDNKEEAQLYFFDSIDFGNGSLVRTNIFPSKIMTYLQKYTPYDEDGFKAAVDMILEKSQANEMVYNLNLNFLLSLFDEIGPDLVFDYLINNYVLDGGCANEQVAYQWKEKVTSYEQLLVGKTAPNIQLDNSKSLTQVVQNSTYSLLFFWSSQCHFCHDQLPELKALYDKYGRELEIIGLSLDTVEEQWQAAVSQNQLKWLNYSELKGWDTSSVKTFKINRTPSYYLLDKERTIIAKPKNASELAEIIKSLYQ